MGHARGAAAVRRAKQSEKDSEVAVAAVAVQLGMLDEAAKIYKEIGR